MITIEDISKENIDDVFKICSHNRFNGPIHKKGIDVRRQWLFDMLEHHGPCVKIAYLDRKPVAQISYYPEEIVPYIHFPRKDVVKLQCIYNPFPNSQRKGVAAAMMKALVDECHTGLDSLGGRPCSFIVTQLFPYEGDLPFNEFYEKFGFRQGYQEMYLEIKGKYLPKERPEYHALPEDRGKAVILYNPACEWGYFFAFKVKELLKGIDTVYPIEIFNIWERPEGYMRRPLQRIVSGNAIVNSQILTGSIFWADQEAFRRRIEEVMKQ